MASKQLEGIMGRMTTATPVAKPAAVSAPKLVEIQAPAAPVEPAAPKRKEPAKKVEPQKAIQAFVPASIDRALKIKAAEEGTTTRTIILRGLKAIGFDVPEEELRDKRGRT